MSDLLEGYTVPVWALFQKLGQNKKFAERIDKDTVLLDGKYKISFSEKAEPYSSLVAFDGFFLRHGLARGSKVLPYEYFIILAGRHAQQSDVHGPEIIKMDTNRSNACHPSDYEDEILPNDYEFIGKTGNGGDIVGARIKSCRHFLALPKGKEGSRSLVCQLKPRSLERRYIMIVASYNEVQFITCNTY